jgi:hypothetical protein
LPTLWKSEREGDAQAYTPPKGFVMRASSSPYKAHLCAVRHFSGIDREG